MLFVGILIAVGAGLSLVVMALLPDLDDDWTLIRTAGARTARYALTASLLFAGVAVVTTSTTWTTFAALPTIVAVAAYAIAGGVDAVGVPTNQVVGRRLPMEGRTGAMAIGVGAGYGAQALLIVVVGALASALSVAVVLSGSLAVAAALSMWIVRSDVDG